MKKRCQYIAEWREKSGLTQAQLSDRIDMSESTVSRLENGLTRYHQDHLNLISEALGVGPSDLLRPPPSAAQAEWDALRNQLTQTRSARALRLLKVILEDDDQTNQTA